MATLVLNRSRASMWTSLALVAAAATGLSVYIYLSSLRAQVPIAGKLVPIVVATTDIEAGTVLSAPMLGLVDHPSRYLPEGALTSPKAAAGRVAAAPILRGEPVTSRKIGKTTGASSVVPPGMRAYSLGAHSGVTIAMIPKPGDRVDVMATFPAEVLGEPTTATILSSARVASVNEGKKPAGPVASQLGSPEAGAKWSITLFVTPEEAERLAMAESLGRIAVVLAPLGDDMTPLPHPVTPANVRS
ncbi:MAG: Flp pilus assembly protein CpaB [Actinomycetota bacterium]|nr:Flp pilus assembly protein CpaB [Actinomycetota bacterium]